jgi:hypothetical protein
LAGAIAIPAGCAAVTPLTFGASAAAVPTGLSNFWSCWPAVEDPDWEEDCEAGALDEEVGLFDCPFDCD